MDYSATPDRHHRLSASASHLTPHCSHFHIRLNRLCTYLLTWKFYFYLRRLSYTCAVTPNYVYDDIYCIFYENPCLTTLKDVSGWNLLLIGFVEPVIYSIINVYVTVWSRSWYCVIRGVRCNEANKIRGAARVAARVRWIKHGAAHTTRLAPPRPRRRTLEQ